MKQYIADAFTDEVFHGNPAAVCVMDDWPAEPLMMAIARENNFSETAFIVREHDAYHLRWFTPGGEIDLCGHATLASAYILMRFYDDTSELTFNTLSGELTVRRHNDLYAMDFPAYDLKPFPVTAAMCEALGLVPSEAYIARDLLCVLDDEEQVRNFRPDYESLKGLDGLIVHITARSYGGDFDCVSRSFAPKLNVNEDPVCGSGHCHIAPYWAGRLGKSELVCWQASPRGGCLWCDVRGSRVIIAGKAVLYSISEILS